MKLIFTLPLLLGIFYANAQTDSLAPYLRNPVLPQFSILQPDSSTWFTKNDLKRGRKAMIMLFSPDCDHCKKQTDIIVDNIDKLKDLEIVMTTFQPVEKMRRFYEKYGLAKYPNIHVGRDVRYFFGPFYRFRYSPFLAIYDERENLIKVYEGGAKGDKLLEALR